MSQVQVWAAQTRANFLLLAVFLVVIGLAFAAMHHSSAFNWFHAVLIMAGAISAHVSVNLFNEYSDFQTKIDFNTERTPFSGGSGMLPAGHTSPGHVSIVAWLTLLFSAAIGIYFTIVSHYSILIIAAIGAVAITLYTPLLSRLLLGELFAGLALGSLVIIGAYIAMVAQP
ncbi:MAG: prenyltransferase, partial [Bacteroidales bacterium]|nr:prenyltransferase [Bacteroidales bacterium]